MDKNKALVSDRQANLEYSIIEPNLFNIKIGKYGIVLISAKVDCDTFLIKTFLSSDMDKIQDRNWFGFNTQNYSFRSRLVHACKKSREVK